MTPETIRIGGRYNWRNQPERLIYVGTAYYTGDWRRWHQFCLVGKLGVWCEVLDSDLPNFEESPLDSQGAAP